jgi:hypothetical protein
LLSAGPGPIPFRLGDPEAHAKILIDPKSDTTEPG